MRCTQCSKHFMTHNSPYVSTLPSQDQVKREFVCGKGNACHISLIRMLRSGLTVAQVMRYVEDEIQEKYLQLKPLFIELWDKVNEYVAHTHTHTHTHTRTYLFFPGMSESLTIYTPSYTRLLMQSLYFSPQAVSMPICTCGYLNVVPHKQPAQTQLIVTN